MYCRVLNVTLSFGELDRTNVSVTFDWGLIIITNHWSVYKILISESHAGQFLQRIYTCVNQNRFSFKRDVQR